jgi:DUF1365 family protein
MPGEVRPRVQFPQPGIYTGKLRHRRRQPKTHEFEYSVFMALLDIDRIPETMAKSAFSSYGRFNWASFVEKDHFGDPHLSLRKRLVLDAAAQGLPLPDGPVYLLTHLRYLGYCFNPISLFYFFDREGNVPVVLAEVNSTFGESRNYWLWSGNQMDGENSLRFRCGKSMHVSPFMPMNLDYQFTLTPPKPEDGSMLVLHMDTPEANSEEAAGFDATLTLTREPWTSANLLRALVRWPWMTAKVMGGIHWEALRLWMKGVPVFTHPNKLNRNTLVKNKLDKSSGAGAAVEIGPEKAEQKS